MAVPAGLLQRIRRLEPLPVTAQQLSRAAQDEDVPMTRIAELIEHDQAVVSTVLRFANSVIYAGLSRVADIGEAVARLGTHQLLDIVLGDFMKRMHVDAPMYQLTENDLWLHGAVASLAVNETIAEAPGVEIPRSASVAALIHDIGKLILVRYLSADVGELLKLSRERDIPFVQAERVVLGCDHAEVGAAVARHWRFPHDVVHAIEFHHGPVPAMASPVLDGVIVGNLVAKTLGAGLGAEGMNFEVDPTLPARQGLDLATFCRVCAGTAEKMERLKVAYGIASPNEAPRGVVT
jgi:putative nucleotidyltransferase with HDIG domain